MQKNPALFGAAIGGGFVAFFLGGAIQVVPLYGAGTDEKADALEQTASWTSAPSAHASLDQDLPELRFKPSGAMERPSRFME